MSPAICQDLTTQAIKTRERRQRLVERNVWAWGGSFVAPALAPTAQQCPRCQKHERLAIVDPLAHRSVVMSI
jgi:hypothetical protein